MGKLKSEETKCISCGNACGGCSWSVDFTPVDGWDAVPTTSRTHGVTSYRVIDCPRYEPERKLNPDDIPDVSVHALAAAVVEQAVIDYRLCIRGRTLAGETNYRGRCKDPEGARLKALEGSMNAIERFFRSDWFYILCDCDGEEIIRRLRNERYLNQVRKARAKMGL